MILKKIKGLFTFNIGLKILAAVMAAILWLFVVNIDDPSQSQNFTTKVQVLNENVLTDQGKYYNVVDNENTVTFRVTAKRSVIERLSNSDFTATADMNMLENDNRIPIEIQANRYAGSLTLASKARYLAVEVGEEMATKFVISGVGVGQPAAGYIIDTVSVTPNVINVDGPSEVVSQIDRVVATCDVDGMSTDITENVVPIFYDKDGNTIDMTKVKLNVSTVEITAKLTNVRTVPIEAEVASDPESGKLVDSVELAPTEISIKGSPAILNTVTKITIPPEAVDITGTEDRLETAVDITSYLPDGVGLADSSQPLVAVAVNVADSVEKAYMIPVSNLEVRNLPDGLKLEFDDNRTEVTIYATANAHNKINASDISGYVDASEVTEGSSGLLINLDLPDNYIVVPSQALVTVSSLDEDNKEDTDNTEESQ